jgi:hypothetical protein
VYRNSIILLLNNCSKQATWKTIDPHHAEGLVYPKVLAKKSVTDVG